MTQRLLLLLLVASSIHVQAQDFLFGVDLSYINEMEDCGAGYSVNGISQDPYHIFSEQGADIVRLRLWHTPSWYDQLNTGERYSDLADVKRSIERAKQNGMKVLLDFHLSDNWADPSNQVAPEAWWPVTNDLPTLQDSLYNYIFQTLTLLAADGLLPEMVQIGNETNKGILLSPEQNGSGWILEWDRNAALFNTAIAAVRSVEENHQAHIKIGIHIADPSSVAWYIEQFVVHDVTDFDIIGISYYWQWHMDSFDDVGQVIESLRSDHPDKEVMILETAYPWTSANADAANNLLSVAYPGFSPFSPERQKDWIVELTQVVIDHGGSGVIYWEPGWVSTDCRTQWAKGSHWDNATFFDHQYELIEAGAVAWMSHAYDNTSSVDFNDYSESGFRLIQTEDGVWISWLGEKWDGLLTIDYYTMDGKFIGRKRVDPGWREGRFRLETDGMGELVVVVFKGGKMVVSGVVVDR